MIDDLFKRLLMSAASFTGAMCLIHLVMEADPGYRDNWVFIFTGQIVWVIGLILKIAFFLALVAGGFYLVIMAIQIHDSWEEQKAEAVLQKSNEEVARRAAVQHAVATRAREFEAIAEEKRKKQELEEHRKKVQTEKFGPRSEDDALAKAMDSLKFGGLE